MVGYSEDFAGRSMTSTPKRPVEWDTMSVFLFVFCQILHADILFGADQYLFQNQMQKLFQNKTKKINPCRKQYVCPFLLLYFFILKACSWA